MELHFPGFLGGREVHNDGDVEFALHVSDDVLDFLVALHHLLVVAFDLRGAPGADVPRHERENPCLLPQEFAVQDVQVGVQEKTVFLVLARSPLVTVLHLATASPPSLVLPFPVDLSLLLP